MVGLGDMSLRGDQGDGLSIHRGMEVYDTEVRKKADEADLYGRRGLTASRSRTAHTRTDRPLAKTDVGRRTEVGQTDVGHAPSQHH